MPSKSASARSPAPSGTTVERARRLMSKLAWLSPLPALTSSASSKFGRQIESSLAEVSDGKVVRLQLRKRDAAVVMSARHYEEMLEMKLLYGALIEQSSAHALNDAAGEYDALYQRLTSADSRSAADDLFSATGDDLRKHYRKGDTENQ